MMVIKEIKKDKRGNSLLRFDEDNLMKINTEIMLKNGIKAGDSLNDDELEKLQKESEIYKAKNKALNLLSYRSRSKKELKEKIQRESGEVYADIAVKKMENLGLLNDKIFAKDYAEELVFKKKFSISGAKYRLREKGIENEIIEEIFNNMEVNEKLQALDVINKRLLKKAVDEKSKNKVVNILVRLGYSWNTIKRAFELFEEQEQERAQAEMFAQKILG